MNKYLVKDGTKLDGLMSISQIGTYLRCPKSWEYSYIHKLTRRVEKTYFTIGKLCHCGMQGAWMGHWLKKNTNECVEEGYKYMESYYNEYLENNILLEEEVDILNNVYEDSKKIFKMAFLGFKPEEYEVYEIDNNTPAIELHFKLPISKTRGFHGYMDLIVRHKETGYIWVVDYKFKSSLSQDEDEKYNLQNSVYSTACDYLGIPCLGSMTYQHLNISPSIPNKNKNGTFSRSKIRTTWEVYKQTLIDSGQDPLEYESEMVEKLSDIEWSRKTFEYRSGDMLNRIWNIIIEPMAKKLTNLKKSKAKDGIKSMICMYPMNCKNCQFSDLCQGQIRGYDVDSIITMEYVTKDAKNVNKIIDNQETDML